MATCLLHRKEFDEKLNKCLDCIDKAIEDSIKKVEKPKLLNELVRLYNLGIPAKILYISDLSNNLAKVHQYMKENVDFTLNKPVSITLTTIEGLPLLQAHYDVVFLDHNLNGIVPIEAFSPYESRIVHGSSQEIM
jgi:phage-related protein